MRLAINSLHGVVPAVLPSDNDSATNRRHSCSAEHTLHQHARDCYPLLLEWANLTTSYIYIINININSGQVVHKILPLSPRSIIWYRQRAKGGDAVWLVKYGSLPLDSRLSPVTCGLAGWPQWRMTYYPTTSVWKMPPSWHWTGHLEVIGSKRSSALKWCRLNNDDDDDDACHN